MSEADDLAEFINGCLSSALTDAGIDPDLTRSIAQHVEEDVRRQYGGDRHYIRKTSPDQIKRRNHEIIRAWKSGKSRTSIASDHDVSRRTVDSVIESHINSKAQQRTGFGREDWVL